MANSFETTDIEASCTELGVPLGIIEALRPMQPNLPFHNEDHTVNQATRTAIRTILTLQSIGLDPDSRTIVPATIGHDIGFDKSLSSESCFASKEERSANTTVEVLKNNFGFKANELRQIRKNIMATIANAQPRRLEDWITRMSDVQNFGDPYQAFVANGARIALETTILNPENTLNDAVEMWYFIGNTILPQYIETRIPMQVSDVSNIPGSTIWKVHASANQRRLIAEKPPDLKRLLLVAHDEFTANDS